MFYVRRFPYTCMAEGEIVCHWDAGPLVPTFCVSYVRHIVKRVNNEVLSWPRRLLASDGTVGESRVILYSKFYMYDQLMVKEQKKPHLLPFLCLYSMEVPFKLNPDYWISREEKPFFPTDDNFGMKGRRQGEKER